MGKKKWDYTQLAKFYDYRVDYNQKLIKNINKKKKKKKKFIEIGCGTGKLTKILIKHFEHLCAVEPNIEMIKVFKKNFKKNKDKITFYKVNGENINFPSKSFDLIFFGSSFNVLNRNKIFKKINEVLKPNGKVIILWNNRLFNDKLQDNIEFIIKQNVKKYKYGLRRSDLKKTLIKSKIFKSIKFYSSKFKYKIKKNFFIEAWKSHGTLFNQTNKENFFNIISQIKKYLMKISTSDFIIVPYVTKVWVCTKK